MKSFMSLSTGTVETINARETAPKNASENMLVNKSNETYAGINHHKLLQLYNTYRLSALVHTQAVDESMYTVNSIFLPLPEIQGCS